MRRCFWVAVGVTCACFCRCAADSFCRGSVQCLLRRMHSILSRFVACTRAVLRPMCVCTGDGRVGRGVRLGCGSCRGVVCRSRRMSLGQEITNIGQYGAVEPWATARGRTERSLRAFGVAAQCDQPNVSGKNKLWQALAKKCALFGDWQKVRTFRRNTHTNPSSTISCIISI